VTFSPPDLPPIDWHWNPRENRHEGQGVRRYHIDWFEERWQSWRVMGKRICPLGEFDHLEEAMLCCSEDQVREETRL